MVEHQRGRQSEPAARGEAVAHFERHERVESHLGEGPRRFDALRRLAGHRRDVRNDQVEEHAALVGHRHDADALDEASLVGCRLGRRGRARHRPYEAAQQGRHGVLTDQRRQVEPGRHERRGARTERDVEQDHRLLGAQWLHPTAFDAPQVRFAQMRGDAAGLRPRPPCQRGRGQAESPAVVGEGIEEGVRGGVVALTRTAEDARRGGEQHERRQVQVRGELVQMPGGVDLRTENARQSLRRQRRDDRVVQHPGRMHDRGERVLGRYLGEQRGNGVAVGGVARPERHLRAQPGKLRSEFAGPLRGLAATTGQQQVPGPVRGYQVPGDQAAEGTGATRDEDRPSRVEHRARVPVHGVRHPGDAGRVRLAVADGDLRFALGASPCQGHGQRLERGGTVIDVDEGEAAGLLGLSGPDQSPYRGP